MSECICKWFDHDTLVVDPKCQSTDHGGIDELLSRLPIPGIRRRSDLSDEGKAAWDKLIKNSLYGRFSSYEAPVTTHELKCEIVFFWQLLTGDKTFEIRFNDRHYQVGDLLLIREWTPGTNCYTNRQILVRVTCITTFQQMPGWIVMGIKPYEQKAGDREKPEIGISLGKEGQAP